MRLLKFFIWIETKRTGGRNRWEVEEKEEMIQIKEEGKKKKNIKNGRMKEKERHKEIDNLQD